MRSEGDFIKINEWLTPLSWLYGIGVNFRNWLFNVGILNTHAFDVPVIAVGNITVGGSGKTPHIEYLVRLLKDKVRVAVLSRGYKRKSSGYLLADDDTPMINIGDEPYQMKHKFSDIYVAVDRNRCRGIDRLTDDEKTKDVEVILLDDAFQHRYVTPGINILLVDYHRLIIYDKLLPAGRLREPEKGKSRADVVIITKCPKDLNPMEFRVLTKAMNLYAYQELYFTTIDYGNLTGLFNNRKMPLSDLKNGYSVLLLTGIASPKQMIIDLLPYTKNIKSLAFSDHHFFTSANIETINSTFASMPQKKIIITTEKDASRLQNVEGLNQEVKDNLYELPIAVKFMLDEEENFNNKIISYVRKNSRNSILAKTKNDDQPRNCHHSGDRPRTISFGNN